MPDFSQIPGGQIVAMIVVIALGIAAAIYWLDRDRRSRKVEEDGAEDRLINILKKTVDELEKKVNEQGDKIEALTKKVADLEEENETLVRVLQGRDEQTQKFYEQAFASMKVAAETNEIVKQLAQGITGTNKNIESMISLLSKHLDVVDHSIRKQ